MKTNKETFEDFLAEIHAKDYKGLDDDMIDDFNHWIVELQFDDIIEYADEYTKQALASQKQSFKQVVEEMKYKDKDFLGKDKPEIVGMKMRNLILDQILDQVFKKP